MEILVIAGYTVIICAESWDDIAFYGRSKLAWLRAFRTAERHSLDGRRLKRIEFPPCTHRAVT